MEKKTRKWPKRVAAALVLLALAALALWRIPLKTHVTRALPGLVFSLEDADWTEACTVSVDGTFRRYLWKDHVFSGALSAPGLPADTGTQAFALQDVPFERDTGYGTLAYTVATEGQTGTNRTFTYPGHVYVHGDFEQPLFLLFGGAGGGQIYDWTYIVAAGVTTRDEALALLARYAESSDWLRASMEQNGYWPLASA